MIYMLDTSICIYVMKEKPEKILSRFKDEIDNGVCISSITLAELEYGMKHSSNPLKNEQALLRFLAPLSILPIGPTAASEYGKFRSCLAAGPFKTLNVSKARFKFEPHLFACSGLVMSNPLPSR